MRPLPIAMAVFVLPLPAAAQDMCAALARIEAAAREAPAFTSLDGPRRELVPGYGPNCWTGTTDEGRFLTCSRSQFAPAGLIAATIGPVIRDCLGAAPLRPARYSPGVLRYGTPKLEVTVHSNCNERCHVGRGASITFRPRRREQSQATDSR